MENRSLESKAKVRKNDNYYYREDPGDEEYVRTNERISAFKYINEALTQNLAVELVRHDLQNNPFLAEEKRARSSK